MFPELNNMYIYINIGRETCSYTYIIRIHYLYVTYTSFITTEYYLLQMRVVFRTFLLDSEKKKRSR